MVVIGVLVTAAAFTPEPNAFANHAELRGQNLEPDALRYRPSRRPPDDRQVFLGQLYALQEHSAGAAANLRRQPGIVIVGVSEDESIAQARQLVDGLGVRFPVIHDETGRLARRYSVARMPVTFVVAKNGNISWVGGPDQTEDGVRAALSAVDRARSRGDLV